MCVPRIGSSPASVGSELPQHDSAVADHERSLVFVDRANNHAIRSDGLGDSDGIALRAQVVHELLDTLLWVWRTDETTEKHNKDAERQKIEREADVREEWWEMMEIVN